MADAKQLGDGNSWEVGMRRHLATLSLGLMIATTLAQPVLAQWKQCQVQETGDGWRVTSNRYVDPQGALQDTMWRLELEAIAIDANEDDQISINTLSTSSLPPIGSILLEVGQKPDQPALGMVRLMAPAFFNGVAALLGGLDGTKPDALTHYLQWSAGSDVLISGQVQFLAESTAAAEVGSGAQVAALYMGHSDAEMPGPGGDAEAFEAARMIEMFLAAGSSEVVTFVDVVSEGKAAESVQAGRFTITPEVIASAAAALASTSEKADAEVDAGRCT